MIACWSCECVTIVAGVGGSIVIVIIWPLVVIIIGGIVGKEIVQWWKVGTILRLEWVGHGVDEMRTNYVVAEVVASIIYFDGFAKGSKGQLDCDLINPLLPAATQNHFFTR